MNDNNHMKIQNLFESESYLIDRVEEDGEVEFHINILGMVTIHLDIDEWNEFVEAMHTLDPE